MRWRCVILDVLFAFSLVLASGTALGQTLSGNLRWSMGNFRPPGSERQLAQQTPSPSREYTLDSDSAVAWGHHHCHRYLPGIVGPTCCWPPWYWYPIYPPPIVLPAELLYGPQATARFVGMPWPPTARTTNYVIIVQQADREDRGNPDDAAQAQQQRQEQAEKYIQRGDDAFRDQRYSTALLHYRKATQLAPKLSAAFARKGFALVAIGSYEAAAEAFRTALELDPRWPKSGFKLDELYQGIRQAKIGQIDALLAAAKEDPQNEKLAFVAGLVLFFDGQQDAAQKYFTMVLEKPGVYSLCAQLFLDALAAEKVAK